MATNTNDNTEQLSFIVPRDLAEKIRSAAEREQRPISNFLRVKVGELVEKESGYRIDIPTPE